MSKTGIALLLGLLAGPGTVSAYTFIYDNGTRNPAGRTTGAVTFTLTFRRPAALIGDPFAAARSAFATWDALTTANITFTDGGQVADDSVGRDGVNKLTFNSTTNINFPQGAVALTTIFFTGGNIIEADIAFNPNPPQSLSVTGASGTADIESIALHEIGHFMGLDHSGLLSACMYPFGNIGNTFKRTLTLDDQIAMSVRYPAVNFSATTGGVVPELSLGDSGIPGRGAQAVALGATDGIVVASALGDDEIQDGVDAIPRLEGLPPGSYKLYFEAMDGPVDTNSFDTNFPGKPFSLPVTRFFDPAAILADSGINDPAQAPNFVVQAGVISTNVVDNHVPTRSTLNITTLNGSVLPVYVLQGASTNLTLTGASFSTSGTLLITGSGVTLSNTTITTTQITTTATVASGATAGPRTILFIGQVNNIQQSSALSGGFVVQAPAALATTTTVAAQSGSGGEAAPTTSSSDGGGKNQSNCCVATVLLGDRTSPGMMTLYAFRNDWLRPSEAGFSVEKTYYGHVSPMARKLASSQALKALGRHILLQAAVQPLQTVQSSASPSQDLAANF
ncbi:MAG: matrixin family metalloprotease [Planctomycetes bacterium]|nr:matrixin family metalloprotease [Planctomycetota bacterium]